ncbi:hypothetical protein SH449x_000830 [Pirellulaceae bacterium SH449]
MRWLITIIDSIRYCASDCESHIVEGQMRLETLSISTGDDATAMMQRDQ